MSHAPVREVYISSRKTYVLTCPACQDTKELHVGELPHSSRPYTHTCQCGVATPMRLISLRAGHRKGVKLAGTLSRSSAKGGVRLFCTVENLSLGGMRITTEPIKQIGQDEVLTVSVVLDEPVKSKLTVRCGLRRMTTEKGHIRLALDFQGLTPAQESLLQHYLASV
jgi:hypothetical protein